MAAPRLTPPAADPHKFIPWVISALVLVLWLFGLLQPLDNWLTDVRYKLTSRAPTGDVVFVSLDAKSLAALGTWPLPRHVYGDLVDALRTLDASEIALDIDFSATSTPEEDTAFVAALKRASGSVILASFSQKNTAAAGDQALATNVPIESFAENSWLAGVGVTPDSDGKVRRFSNGAIVDGEIVPSLPVMLSGAIVQNNASFVIDYGIDLDRITQVSAVDLLNGAIAKSLIQGKRVIIGASAVELRDFFQVPRFGIIPGALLEAVSTETLLQGRALVRPGAVPVGLALAAFTFAFAASNRRRWTLRLAALGCLSLLCETLAVIVQKSLPLMIDTAPFHASFLAFAVGIVINETNGLGLLVLLTRRELGDTQTILDQVIADNFAGILIVDENASVERASRAAADLLGFHDSAALIGRSLSELVPVDLVTASAEAIASLKSARWQREASYRELQIKLDDGSKRILEYVATPSLLDGDRTAGGAQVPRRYVCCLTLVDVTQRREAHARLSYLANFDTVTGLANRVQFGGHLSKVLNGPEAMRCAVIFLDLDRFKSVNDTLGHRLGDVLLQEVAARARSLVGHNDLVARLGGDEYAIILTDRRNYAEINRVARALIDVLAKPYDLQGHRVVIGVSAGVAQAAEHDRPQDLMRNADTALYRAKAEGGNCYRWFEVAMDAALRARQKIEVDSWDALARNEFSVFYQPQVDLSSNRIVGVEALVRWRHPTRGFIAPSEFIPVAEDTGLIEHLGAWVLHEACAEVARWPGDVRLAVNVSPVQFARGNLVKTIKEALEISGLPADRLELEITENLFMTQSSAVVAIIKSLRELGIAFSLDDFGTGYSSLSYLRKFPVAKIKVDKSFVDGIPRDQEAMAVIRAVSALAQSLKIAMNAEGIESVSQALLLRSLGCNEGQGYLFGKPQPGSELRQLLGRPAADLAAVEPQSNAVPRALLQALPS